MGCHKLQLAWSDVNLGASNLGIERAAAQMYIEKYFQRFSGVKQFMDDTRAQAKSNGFVETVFDPLL